MRRRRILYATALALAALALAGCAGNTPDYSANTSGGQPQAAPTPTGPGPLPEGGYKAQITLADPPTKMRAGQKQTLNVKVRNASDVTWPRPQAGVEGNKFVVAIMDTWLDADGQLVSNMDGRYGIQQDLPPGQEMELPLQITAPSKPGDYTLELDMVQEQVTFFKDRGSEPLKVKVKVE